MLGSILAILLTQTGTNGQHAEFKALIAGQKLDKQQLRGVSAEMLRRGYERIENRVMEESGVLLVRATGTTPQKEKDLAHSLAGIAHFHFVPVAETAGSLTIVAPRYMVFFDRTVQETEAERRLEKVGFVIASRPGRYQDYFMVTRSLESGKRDAELSVLRSVPGVTRVSAQVFVGPKT